MKRYIVFKKYGKFWAIPLSQAHKPQVKKLLESSIIVEAPKSLFGKPRVYKVRKRKLKVERKLKKIETKVRKRVKKLKRRGKPTGRPMPLALQRKILERIAMKYEVPTDIIDWDRLDPTLTFPENRRVIEEQIKRLTKRTDLVLEEIPLERLDADWRRFVENLIWKWEAGDTKDLELFGVDPKKIKSKKDILSLFL